jgi:hypothetical protein
MYEYRLKTQMQSSSHGGCPRSGPRGVIRIDKGGTATFGLYFVNKTYTFEDLKQLTFMFKYGVNRLEYFTLFDEESGEIDPGSPEAGYALEYNKEANAVFLELKPKITDRFPAEKPVEYEIAVKINDDDVIIERQPVVWPVDTLYSQIEGGGQPESPEYASQGLFCSADLTCC